MHIFLNQTNKIKIESMILRVSYYLLANFAFLKKTVAFLKQVDFAKKVVGHP